MNQKLKGMLGVACTFVCGLCLPHPVLAQAIPDSKGKAEFVHNCTACHRADLVVAKKKTPEDWRKSVDEMASRGTDGSKENLDNVYRYLVKYWALEVPAPALQSAPPPPTPNGSATPSPPNLDYAETHPKTADMRAYLVSARAAQAPSSRLEILALMEKVNAWQKAHPIMRPNDRNWERGTWYVGVMAAWEATHDATFLDQSMAWGKLNDWQFGTEPRGANRLFCVETWAELYLVKKDPAMIAPALSWLDAKDEFSPAGAKRWYLDRGTPYVDSLFGAPALAMLAKGTERQEYLTVMDSFFDEITATLFDQETGLYYRDPSFISMRNEHGKKVLWSRGNGWAFAGIARILEYLPRNDSRRKRYIEIYKRMAAAIVARQPDDGLWRPNLDDPTVPDNPESSGSAFFTYGLAWGIRNGFLDRARYLPPTQKAFIALVDAVSPEGKVQWGQLVDSRPNASTKGNTHEYVTGAFLLAASEAYRLGLHTH